MVEVATIKKLPRFSEIDDDLVQLELDEATEVVEHSGLPKSVRDRAVRMYACHLLTEELQQADGLQSFTIGPISKTKLSPNYKDRFLKQYEDLLDSYGLNSSRGRAWSID